jgi:hypothetical protein
MNVENALVTNNIWNTSIAMLSAAHNVTSDDDSIPYELLSSPEPIEDLGPAVTQEFIDRAIRQIESRILIAA